jgi:hypothetical protein
VSGIARGVGVVVILSGVAAFGGAACDEKKGSGGADAGVGASVSASPVASVAVHASASPGSGTGTGTGRDGGMVICKVMASEGGPSASADATGWLDVAARANFTVRTLETGRELRFEGPGRVRACADDVALVAEGSAVGLPGSGEAPGAEQWVATACGAVRWASGVHRFVGGRDACRLQSSMGSAHLYLAEDVTAEDVAVDGGAPDGGPHLAGDAGPGAARGADAGADRSPWRRIDARRALALHGHGTLDTPAAVKTALVACERASKDVQRIATSLTTGDAGADGGSAGELAAESVAARGIARAACSVAAVRIALAGSKAPDQARLDAANSSWRTPR